MLERIEKLKRAVIIERDEELKRFTTLLNEQAIQDRIAEGITLYPIEFSNIHYSAFEELILEFGINEDQDPYKFSANGRVELFNGNNSEKIEGTIVQFKNGILSVQPQDNEDPDWLKSGKLGLNALPDTKTSDMQIATLDKIIAGDLRMANLFYNNPAKVDYAPVDSNFDDLNESQNEAVGQMLSSNPFHIVHGPPGTGKTRTITKAILALAKSGKKVLVAAPSNAAVDHITRQLTIENRQVTRIGNSFKISEDILPFTLKSQIYNHQLTDVVKRLKKQAEAIRKKAFKYKRNFGKEEYQERKTLRNELREIRKDIRKMEREIAAHCLEQSQIITGTFAGLQDRRLDKLELDAVFADEAGQALEPSVWSVAHFAPQLFLAGDPLQLPPTLFSNEAVKLGLSVSLIEKGMELGIPTSLLDTQYRMNDQIMQFSNGQFYENKLKSDENVKGKALANDSYSPVEFIDTAGCGYDEKNDEAGGIFNPGEAELLIKRLNELDNSGATGYSIGIISPYRKQVTHLQEIVEKHAQNCQTIDSFQGQERDLIILSLVRSNASATIGFLSDYRRMNVALTRAKKKLIVIGDSATIGSDTFYQSFLDYVEKNGTYRSGWEFMD